MAAGSGITQAWEKALEKRQDDLTVLLSILARKYKKANPSSLPLVTLEEAIRLKDFDSFEASLNRLCTHYTAKGALKTFSKYLYPHLEHLRSFNNAISSATSGEAAASLTWGLMLIVIQCGCIFVESLDEIMQQLEGLQNLLPDFQQDMELYPTSATLRFLLQDIFTDYVDYCIIIVRNLTRPPLINIIRSLISSSLVRDLRKMKAKLGNDVISFERAVERAERSRAKNADDRNQVSRATDILTPPTFPIYSVNIGENHDFIGGENELDNLYNTLVRSHADAKPVSCVIHGIGGVGKTQTALKFTYKYRSDFQAVFWVSADPERGTEILRTFGAIGRKLRLFDTEDIDQAKVETIVDWLQTTEKRWLLVFDNVVDWESVSRYWPTRSATPSAIIVTSQKATSWTDHRLSLEPLDSQEGSKFLLSQLHMSDIDRFDPKRKLAGEISEELGGSPLYLSHAQGSMALSKSSLEEFLDTIRTSSNTLGIRSSNVWRYERAVSATHDRIMKELSQDATEFLFMLAFMSPDYISEDLFFCRTRNKDIPFLSDKPVYLRCIAELADGQLVKREFDGDRMYLSTHRATQRAMLHKLDNDPGSRNTAFCRVVDLLRVNFPSPSNLQIAEAHVWPLIKRILPHLQSILRAFERARPAIAGSFVFAELLADVGGMDLYDRGQIHEAYKLSSKAVAILDSLGTPMETPLRGDALTVIGLCTDVMGVDKRLEGLEVREKCLEVRQRCYHMIPPREVTVADRIRLYNSYMDLVCSQQQFNDFDKIERNAEKCFVQYKSWGDENKFPYEHAKYYNQMAYVFLYEGKTAKAVEFAKKGFELAEKATPGTQLAVLNKFDWANILFQDGYVEQSLKAHKDILRIRKTECGKENIRTLESRLNIGIIHYFEGQLDQAEKQIGKALAVSDRALWPSENVARARYYLSQVLKRRDLHDQQAASLEQEAQATVAQLLRHEGLGKAVAYHGSYPILLDFMVPWECRLVTPRQGQYQVAATPTTDGTVNDNTNKAIL